MSDMQKLNDDRLDEPQDGEWVIVDWAGNVMNFQKRFVLPQSAVPLVFESFYDAEESLSELLGDNYETDRGEYYVMERKELKRGI